MNPDMLPELSQPAHTTSRGATFPWIKVASIGAVVTPVVLVALTVVFVLGQREQRKREAEGLASLQQDIRSMTAEVRASHASSWVELKDVVHDCVATNGEVTCTFVNLREDPLSTCGRGRITSKQSSGLHLDSLPLCTGRLAPKETRTVSAPLTGGRAKDICNSPARFGGGTDLDWDKCDFEVRPFNAPGTTQATAAR